MTLPAATADNIYWVLALTVLADQSGLPLPAAPFLLGAGAMVRAGHCQPLPLLLLAVGASVLGHTAWYVAGRRRGTAVLRWVCELALEPDACVRRAQDTFARLGPLSLIAARFIPGIDTMAQPLAGMSGMPPAQYLALTVAGALLWAGSLLGAGVLFGEQIAAAGRALGSPRQWLVPAFGALVLVYLGSKLVGRWRALRDTRMARMSVDELKARLDAGEPTLVVDMRHPLEARLYPHTIPGALRLSKGDLTERLRSGTAPKEVVLFCNCPYEIGSARLAQTLARRGLPRVRPLEGGLDAWQRQQFPVVPLPSARR